MDSNPDGASYYRDVFQSIEEQMGYQPRNGYINTFIMAIISEIKAVGFR